MITIIIITIIIIIIIITIKLLYQNILFLLFSIELETTKTNFSIVIERKEKKGYEENIKF